MAKKETAPEKKEVSELEVLTETLKEKGFVSDYDLIRTREKLETQE